MGLWPVCARCSSSTAENLIQPIANLRLVPAAARTWKAGHRNDLCGLTHLRRPVWLLLVFVPQPRGEV
jgi:hypothetical protein